jgi:hypothetical protein
MKKRQGFVSNSSTACFIVRHKGIDILGARKSKKGLLTKKEISILKKIGFERTHHINPLHYSKEPQPVETGFYNYGFDVTVNEFEIIEQLIKNNISFTASCHYDQYLVFYDKTSKKVYVFKNAGQHYMMNTSNIEELSLQKCCKTMSVKEFLKEGYYI